MNRFFRGRRPCRGARILASALASLLVGCSGGSDRTASSAAHPEEPGTATCALCAMVVREQPASRGQVLHRDGKRVFLCSISELPNYVGAPSPNGKPVAVWVEALRVEDGPDSRTTEPRPWVPADSARYVVGGPARPVMGESVLPYASPAAADSVAGACGGTVLPWPALVERLTGGRS